MSTTHVGHIPHYIESRSPKGLRDLMLSTNIEDSTQYRYFDISSYVDKKGKTRWVAWFYKDIKETLISEAKDGNA